MKKKTIKLVRNLLMARRNGNIKQEQTEYVKLRRFCNLNNIDFTHALDGATKWLRTNSVSAIMNSII